MKNIVLAVLASMLLAGAAYADHANDENHEGEGSGSPSTVTNTNTNTNVNSTNVSVETSASASASQEQGQFQAQGNVQKLTIEDADNAASSAANLFLANCTSGASAQGFGGGGSLGGPDDVCLLFNYAQIQALALGNPEEAAWAMGEAKNILKIRTNPLRRIFQAIPIIGKIM